MNIKKNVGRTDRVLRLVSGFGLVLAGALPMKGNALVMAIGLVMIIVAFIGFCPAYLPFGISTRKRVP